MEDLRGLLELGAAGVYLAAVIVLWRRNTALSDRILSLLERRCESSQDATD